MNIINNRNNKRQRSICSSTIDLSPFVCCKSKILGKKRSLIGLVNYKSNHFWFVRRPFTGKGAIEWWLFPLFFAEAQWGHTPEITFVDFFFKRNFSHFRSFLLLKRKLCRVFNWKKNSRTFKKWWIQLKDSFRVGEGGGGLRGFKQDLPKEMCLIKKLKCI